MPHEHDVYVRFRVRADLGSQARTTVQERLEALDDLYRGHPNNLTGEGPFDDETFRDWEVTS